MSSIGTFTYKPRTKERRRRRCPPFNHVKNIGKRSCHKGQKKKNRGQGK